jgi:hypothetical protein
VSLEALEELAQLGRDLGAPESDLELVAGLRRELLQQRQKVDAVLKAESFNEALKRKCQNEILVANKFDIPEIHLLENKVVAALIQ